MDPAQGEVETKIVSFADFVHLVVQGPKELADFISENKLHGESLGIDTGMVDSKGESAKRDSYWHQCGLCHPDFRPHYILDFEHAKEDQAVSEPELIFISLNSSDVFTNFFHDFFLHIFLSLSS